MSVVHPCLLLPVVFGFFGVHGFLLLGGGLYNLPPTCQSKIYCQGKLLHDVQLAQLNNDSKTFVDMKLKYPEDEVLAKYEQLRKQYTGSSPPREKLKEFVDANFEHGDELQPWRPTDFNPKPSLVKRVTDPRAKAWIEDLNNIFLNLSRKVKQDVKVNPGLYSLLYVPNGFVIPGGRFLELYYWDTYWIISGLLLVDMVDTARGVIENFFYLLRTHNIVPNGSRKYYLRRSQPPLLIPMVERYFQHTNNLTFVRDNIELLEKEFNFWMTNRMVWVMKDYRFHLLARYYAPSTGPRPESYREDYNTAKFLATEEEKNELYVKIKSVAESGHDFSTRWFIKDGTNGGNLTNVDAPHIIPVDLNAFLEYNARVLSSFHLALGNAVKAVHYRICAQRLLQAIQAVLWNDRRGIWLDYDIKNGRSRDYFYMSNFAPLWTGSYGQRKVVISKRVLNYLVQNKADQYISGVPTSLYASGEQWDFPNGWPPLQDILIEGLLRLGTQEAIDMARQLAEKWLHSNYEGYTTYHKMFEKYDVTKVGLSGSGGEYEKQTGFGWTNGVALLLLDLFRDIDLSGVANTKGAE